jgi:hypothetical protein
MATRIRSTLNVADGAGIDSSNEVMTLTLRPTHSAGPDASQPRFAQHAADECVVGLSAEPRQTRLSLRFACRCFRHGQALRYIDSV